MADSQSATTASKARTSSMSQASETSQTAADFIKEQLNLEKEAREALPYQFDTCTRDLGPLRQSLYACLTCNPAPASSAQQYTPAGVCYSCSISCHGEHILVELFSKRNFICDCGTTRIPDMTPCTLRINAETGRKGDVTGEEPAKTNEYNQNFRNKFCGCSQEYDPDQEKGTMFQCLGLGSCNDGGCGEDWWHPECLVGFTREEFSKMIEKPKAKESNGATDAMDVDKPATEKTKVEENQEAMAPPGQTSITAAVENGNGVDGNDLAADGVEEEDDDPPLPPGFPAEEDFDHFICYKCVAANPWIKKYAGSTGFLPPIYHSSAWAVAQAAKPITLDPEPTTSDSKKRKATDEDETQQTPSTLAAPAPAKRQRSEDPKEETYEPPVSASGDDNNDAEGAQSVGTGSILDRGEAAFNNMDRVRAIQGAMAYAHLKDKVAAFLKPFAESGTPVGAEDVKAYFEKLRGDEKGIAEAKGGARREGDGGGGGEDGEGGRKEQSGY
ncbi:Metaphase-anaphase transition protein [Pyrenophora tritici-repentis]|nr:Metaphase-anaphase transition protein [Pyrenophora tritici-repentis]